MGWTCEPHLAVTQSMCVMVDSLHLPLFFPLNINISISNLLYNLLKKTKWFRGNVFQVDLSFSGIFKIMLTNTLTLTWHVGR